MKLAFRSEVLSSSYGNTSWYVYKDLIWRAELCLRRFQFASYCCESLLINFISGLFFGSGSVLLVH